jgi:HSP90 family molecular chaperone
MQEEGGSKLTTGKLFINNSSFDNSNSPHLPEEQATLIRVLIEQKMEDMAKGMMMQLRQEKIQSLKEIKMAVENYKEEMDLLWQEQSQQINEQIDKMKQLLSDHDKVKSSPSLSRLQQYQELSK